MLLVRDVALVVDQSSTLLHELGEGRDVGHGSNGRRPDVDLRGLVVRRVYSFYFSFRRETEALERTDGALPLLIPVPRGLLEPCSPSSQINEPLAPLQTKARRGIYPSWRSCATKKPERSPGDAAGLV